MARALPWASSLAAIAALTACTFPDIIVDGDAGGGGSCPGVAACTSTAMSCASSADTQHDACAQGCMRQGCKQGCDDTRSAALTACETMCEACSGCAGATSAACQQVTTPH